MDARPQSTHEYLVIDHGSRLETTSWKGPVVIGSEAIYIFKESPERLPWRGLYGLIVAAVQYVADRTLPARDVPAGSYADIRAAVVEDPGWPFAADPGWPVVIVPREAVVVIHHGRGAHEMEMELSGMPVVVRWGQFGGSRIMEFLSARGWPLLWNGKVHNIDPLKRSSLPKPRAPRLATLIMAAALLLVILTILGWTLLPARQTNGVVGGFMGVVVIFSFLLGLYGAFALRRGL